MNDIVIGRSEKDKKKFGNKGVVFLGKHYIQMGRTTSLSNDVFLDVINSHVVFICGKRGGGKCLAGDTRITLSDGSVKKIDELENNDQEIISLNEDLKIRSMGKENFFKRIVDKTLLLTLETGKKVRLTPEHPLLTVSGWVEAKNLRVGSKIATPKIQRVFGEYDLSEAKVKLLAYLVAGCIVKKNFILFNIKDSILVSDFCSSIKQFDSNLIIENNDCFSVKILETNIDCFFDKNKNLSVDSRNLYVRDLKNSLSKLLDLSDCPGMTLENKFVPQDIFKLPKHKLSLFLNRLFSCDGRLCCEDDEWKIYYDSNSEKLVNDVQHLLSRFGIVSILKNKRQGSSFGPKYELIVQGSFLRSFIEEIGFFGNKQKIQKRAFLETEKVKNNSNLDNIPKELLTFCDHTLPVVNDDGLGYNLFENVVNQGSSYCSEQRLAQISINDKHDAVNKLVNSDIYWDEIICVEEIDESIPVYDFSVPDTHNFVANDIIVHNSYTMGVIAEGVADLPEEIKQNLSIILVDTMGVYWTMKYGNKQDPDLLDSWGLQGKGLDVKIFTPSGYHDEFKEKGIPTDYPFSIKPSELSGHDWVVTFGLSEDDPVGVLIEKVIYDLKESGKDYGIKDIIKSLDAEKSAEENEVNAAKNRFLNADNWGLFSKTATKISDIAMPGQVTVLDVSCYATMQGSWKIKNLVVGLVAEKLFIQRMTARKEEEYLDLHKSLNPYSDEAVKKQNFPLVWLVLDEAHEFLPVKGKTLATDPLVTILREGRQPGISLILATQQPGKIHTDVMTQSDTVIAHRITAKMDTDALGMLMQSYMRKGLVEELDNLPREKGAAIIFDDTNEKMYPVRIRPRFTWHGGGSPTAIHDVDED
ncbi:hypothetical protein K9L97_02320 [Candidatus Woesearchaeota archaeon]|nr:hypothetical protein [Candidatus Woesearchaeota archaeon]